MEIETNGAEGTQAPQDSGQNVKQDVPNAAAIRKSTQNGFLAAASNATGQQFDSMEDLMATLARLQKLEASAKAAPAKVEDESVAKKQQSKNDLEDVVKQMKLDMEAKEQKLRERDRDNDIRRAMGNKIDPAFTDYAVSQIVNSLGQDGESFFVKDAQGRARYTQNGTPMTIQDLVDEMVKTQPKLLTVQPNQSNGSNLRPSDGIFHGNHDNGSVPDFLTDPAAFKAWEARNGLGRGNGLKGVGVSLTASDVQHKIY